MSKERLVELLTIAVGDCNLTDSEIKIVADYLLANGVIVPPCKVGDKVYMTIHDKRVKQPYECTVIGFWYTNHEDCCTLHLSRYVDGRPHSTFSVRFTDVGKTVFLTREEAEAKLKELRSEDLTHKC